MCIIGLLVSLRFWLFIVKERYWFRKQSNLIINDMIDYKCKLIVYFNNKDRSWFLLKILREFKMRNYSIGGKIVNLFNFTHGNTNLSRFYNHTQFHNPINSWNLAVTHIFYLFRTSSQNLRPKIILILKSFNDKQILAQTIKNITVPKHFTDIEYVQSRPDS